MIYNSNSIQGQCKLWTELTGMSLLNTLWLILGDFNAVISQEEHRGGSHYYYSRKADAFTNFIVTNNLLTVNFIGSQFTWCNNQQDLARRWARLDRCLVNVIWANKFESCLVKHMPRYMSDHSPLLLNLFPRNYGKKKIFCFENYWFDHVGCHDAVRDTWSFDTCSKPMQTITHLLARTRHRLLT